MVRVLGELDAERTVDLRNGSHVIVRPVRRDDRDAIRDAFEHLTSESRHSRFLGLMDTLSEAQLRYLTEIDHREHEALVAFEADGRRVLGVARFVRSADDPRVAEAAVVVADEWQGVGLGTALCRLLADRAREEGIERFEATLLAGNDRVLHLLGALGPLRVVSRDGPTITAEVGLPARGVGEHMRGVLRTVARGEAELAPREPRD